MANAGNEKKHCYKYPRPAVTVDVVCFYPEADGVKVLLIRRGKDPFKDCWALPGGFVEMTEELESAARRELKEETGFDAAIMDQFYTFGWPDRDPRGRTISVAFLAWIDGSQAQACAAVHGGDDAAEAKWFDLRELPALAFDHKQIIDKAMATSREWRESGKLKDITDVDL
jgi:8-oxo-dGTP diphosphatase